MTTAISRTQLLVFVIIVGAFTAGVYHMDQNVASRYGELPLTTLFLVSVVPVLGWYQDYYITNSICYRWFASNCLLFTIFHIEHFFFILFLGLLFFVQVQNMTHEARFIIRRDRFR